MMKSMLIGAALASLSIAYEDGVWSGHDWYNEDEGVGIKNGQPYGQDPEM